MKKRLKDELAIAMNCSPCLLRTAIEKMRQNCFGGKMRLATARKMAVKLWKEVCEQVVGRMPPPHTARSAKEIRKNNHLKWYEKKCLLVHY